MSPKKLSAFHNQEKNKQIAIRQVSNWLQRQTKPLSAQELALKIINPNKSSEASNFILENYDQFPASLGLPIWLANLLSTIHHNNSSNFTELYPNYEESFYPAFIEACSVGIDYSLMFHQWEIFLLAELIPESERNKPYILRCIDLHKKALINESPINSQWENLQIELENTLQCLDELSGVPDDLGLKEIALLENLKKAKENTNPEYNQLQKKAFALHRVRKSYKNIIWNSGRVAFLSIAEYINPDEFYTSSSEAIVDAIWEQFVKEGNNFDKNCEKQIRTATWEKIMNKLLIMLKEWS